ncbi:MAG TPA: hypothetical protein VHL80_18540 [Polyangia bacterium]|nr:hypothetical protein [Polyangia bacterium]
MGCGSAAKPPAMQTASAAVTPEAGGTVKLADDSVKLDVPPGAVDGDKTITMTTTDATAPQGITADSPILQFEPSGTVFKAPVTVTFAFKSAKDPVVFWSNSMGGYDMIEGTVTGNSIAAPVMHFSTGFVGDRPPGGSATCSDGVKCSAGMSCGYGGATSAGAHSGSSGGTQTGTSGGTMGGGAADASASAGPATNDPGAGHTMSALSSSDPSSGASSAAICCSCGADGTLHCSTCPDSGSIASTCVEGGACTPGTGCGAGASSGGGSPAGGGTSTGGTGTGSGGAADASVSAGPATNPGAGHTMSALSSSDPSASATCCTCGSDGHYHCGGTCMPPSGGADASAGGGTITGGGTGGAQDGGAASGGDPSGSCTPGAACQPGAPACGTASTGGACMMCACGQDGTRSCASCDHDPQTDAGLGGPTTVCQQGASCAQGPADCGGTSTGSCQTCHCDPTSGMYKCAPCGGAADGGAPAGGGTGGSGGTTLPPDACMQGLKCPQPGLACMGMTVNGVCPKCTCGQDGTLSCAQVACQ